jgi:hypothetical protein
MAKAKLTTDKDNFYVFDYQPSNLQVAISSDLARNQVLDTNEPDIQVKSTSTSFTLSSCLLVSQGLTKSKKVQLEQLKKLARSRNTLEFSYGTEKLNVVISSIDYSIKKWVGSEPTWVELNITLQGCSLFRAASKAKVTGATSKKMTANQKQQATTHIRKLLSIPTNSKKYGTTANTRIEIDTDNKVVTLTTGKKVSKRPLADFN